MSSDDEQRLICERYSAPFLESHTYMKVGISRNIKNGIWPIHGLRHPIINDTTGWYIWAGEFSEDADFFVPVHVQHLHEICPDIVKYLGLAPGWRFLIADNYEDVWEDLGLLDITL